MEEQGGENGCHMALEDCLYMVLTECVLPHLDYAKDYGVNGGKYEGEQPETNPIVTISKRLFPRLLANGLTIIVYLFDINRNFDGSTFKKICSTRMV